jgi:hypothetical protein
MVRMKEKKQMKKWPVILGLTTLLVSTGCSTHSIMLIKDKTTFAPSGTQHYTAHTNRVFITQAPLPPSIKAQVIGRIDVGTVMYNAPHIVYCRMAAKAREIGADAIVDAKTWFQPCGWSWSAPHGKGIAIKLLEGAAGDVSWPKGEWY